MPVPQESLFVVEQASCLLLKPSSTVLDYRVFAGLNYLFSLALWGE